MRFQPNPRRSILLQYGRLIFQHRRAHIHSAFHPVGIILLRIEPCRDYIHVAVSFDSRRFVQANWSSLSTDSREISMGLSNSKDLVQIEMSELTLVLKQSEL